MLSLTNCLCTLNFRSLLEVYLDSEYMDLITRCEPDETEGLMKSQQALSLQLYSATQQQQSSTLLEINSNILQTCLLLEGVAVCMQVCSLSTYIIHTMSSLYLKGSGPVFTKILGSFLRITLKSKKNSLLRSFLFLE